MALDVAIHDNLMKNYSFWDFKGEVDYVDEWFLMRTPVPLFILTLGYMLFVLKLGPNYMNTKSPLKSKNILSLYNFIQIGFSIYLFYRGTNSLLWWSGFIDSSCLLESKDESNYILSSTIYLYFVAKITELLDTIFFVLKKNYHQISYLHLYHHMSMPWYTWLTLKYEPSYSTIFLGTTNSFVHIIMYSYYCLSSYPELKKYLWWKKYITKIQITQFLIIILHATVNYSFSGCRPSYVLLIVIVANGVFHTALFTQFYLSTYEKSKNAKLKE